MRKFNLLLAAMLLLTGMLITSCGDTAQNAKDAVEETATDAKEMVEDAAQKVEEGADAAVEAVKDAVEGEDQSGPEYTSKYICSMHCKGSGSAEPGKCPACGMAYVLNEQTLTGETDADAHDGHNH